MESDKYLIAEDIPVPVPVFTNCTTVGEKMFWLTNAT